MVDCPSDCLNAVADHAAAVVVVELAESNHPNHQ